MVRSLPSLPPGWRSLSCWRRSCPVGRTPLSCPLVAALSAIYVALPIAGFSLADAQLAGWMFQSQPTAWVVSPWQPAELRTFPWTALPWLTGDVLAVMFVTTISLLLNITGVEMATRRDSDINRELRALGLASLLSSA